MTTPLACADLADAVVAQPAPLIFLDTAAILDVLRVPYRDSVQIDIIDSCFACVNDCDTDPRSLWLVASGNVIRELGDNRESVEKDLTTHSRKLASSLGRFATVSAKAFPRKQINFPDPITLRLDRRLSEIVDHLLDAMSVFGGSPKCGEKARERVWAGLPPASKAKQEFKDCEIFEEFLELASLVRKGKCPVPAIFVTPNARDYGPPVTGHPQIQADLEVLGAQYCSNLSWARSLLP